MTESGIGVDGLLRIQRETTYGTPVMSSPIYLPILPDTDILYDNQRIENANQIGSRIKQLPNEGRKLVSGAINMDAYPDLPVVWLDFENGGEGVFALKACDFV